MWTHPNTFFGWSFKVSERPSKFAVDVRLRSQLNTFFLANIFMKPKNFAKPFCPFIIGPNKAVWPKKVQKSQDTVLLTWMSWIIQYSKYIQYIIIFHTNSQNLVDVLFKIDACLIFFARLYSLETARPF